jgi:hypothetical protein
MLHPGLRWSFILNKAPSVHAQDQVTGLRRLTGRYILESCSHLFPFSLRLLEPSLPSTIILVNAPLAHGVSRPPVHSKKLSPPNGVITSYADRAGTHASMSV